MKTGAKFLKHRGRKALGEDVSKLRGGGNMENSNIINGNPLTDEMEIDLNVLRALVLNWIGGQINCTNVITVDQCTPRQQSMQFL
jgi:hypothetical protein